MKTTKHIIVAVCLILISINGFGCNSGKEEKSGNKDIKVDSTKVSPAVADNFIEVFYQPPVNWVTLPAQESSQMVEADPQDSVRTLFRYLISSVYKDTISRSMLFTGRVKINNPEMEMDEAIKKWSEDILTKFNPDEITQDRIEINDIEMTRFRIERTDLIAFKLIFPNSRGEIVQFDYTIRKSAYESLKDAVESSIATIKILK